MEKKLYPMKFIPAPSIKPWGGTMLINSLAKKFVQVDEQGEEIELDPASPVGESWELADMGVEDSVVAEGWLAGNTISDVMETYLERVVGENVYNFYGRQFPLLIKFLDINGKLSVQVHPDDETAAERYDSLGKPELWYVMDARPDAKIYVGFKKDMTAQEFYDRCLSGTVEEVLNVIYPKKGDVLYITPGTVHSADGGLLIAEIQESSDMIFRLYDWGREFDPQTARPMHLEEAIDIIDYNAFNWKQYRKGPLWGDEASCEPCCGCSDDHGGCGHCEDGCCEEGHCEDEHCEDGCSHGEHCHCHEHHDHHGGTHGGVTEILVECPQFNVTKINLSDPLHIYTEQFESFIVYVCIEGSASIQVPSVNEKGEACMDNYEFVKGETVLVPAEMPDFYLVPRDRSTILLEAVTRPEEYVDDYIDLSTEAYLEDEDYEGLEDGAFDDDVPAGNGTSPLKFFS